MVFTVISIIIVIIFTLLLVGVCIDFRTRLNTCTECYKVYQPSLSGGDDLYCKDCVKSQKERENQEKEREKNFYYGAEWVRFKKSQYLEQWAEQEKKRKKNQHK